MAINPYESTRLLDQYILFHYGTPSQIVPYAFAPTDATDFPVRTARAFNLVGIDGDRRRSALDLGCAVGRSAFELSSEFDRVVAIDYSQRFIDAAEHLRKHGTLEYERCEEGVLTSPLLAVLPDCAKPARVDFRHGDVMDLPDDLGVFDLVHAANLLCRLSHPMRLLSRIPELVHSGGLLVLATPCTWTEEFTAPDHWLGGYAEDGKRFRTLDRLKELLECHFDLELSQDVPFLLREHARKFQWGVSLLSVWRRKG